jgi:hypothetical protein
MSRIGRLKSNGIETVVVLRLCITSAFHSWSPVHTLWKCVCVLWIGLVHCSVLLTQRNITHRTGQVYFPNVRSLLGLICLLSLYYTKCIMVYSVARGPHVSLGLCITGWKWVIEFLAPYWDGCHGNWQSPPPARCIWLSSVFRFSYLLCYPLFLSLSLFVIGLVIPTITWLRSGFRLRGLYFHILSFQDITINIWSISVADFIDWRIIISCINEIFLLPRCRFLVLTRYFSFFGWIPSNLPRPLHFCVRPRWVVVTLPRSNLCEHKRVKIVFGVFPIWSPACSSAVLVKLCRTVSLGSFELM